MSPVDAPRQVGDVGIQLGQLAAALEVLTSLAAETEARFAPVLRPSPPEVSRPGNADPRPTPATELARAIDAQTARVETIQRTLRDVLNRCEL